MIFTIKSTIGGWPDNFQDIVFKSTKAYDILNVMVKTVPANTSLAKIEFLKKLCFLLKKGMFSVFLLVYEECLKRTNLKR